MNADDADVHDENWRVSNPCACDFDFLFYGVRTGMLCLMLLVCSTQCFITEETLSFIKDVNMDSGTLVFETPPEDKDETCT